MPTPLLRVAVLADTHMSPDRRTALPDRVRTELEHADVILHAGDVLTRELLDDLSGYAPVHAVLGNNDHALVGELPDRLELELAGVSVAMVHDSGARDGRPRRMRRWFPDADLVVFGHSHEPADELGEDGQRLFNPGSPTQRRRQPNRTIGLLDLSDRRVARSQIIIVDD